MPRLVPPEIKALKIRLAAAQLDALYLRNGVASGELVDRKSVELALGDRISRCRMVMLSWPGRLSNEIAEIVGADPAAVQRILREQVRATLNTMAEAEAQAASEARARFGEAEPVPAPVKKKRTGRKTGRPRGKPPGAVTIYFCNGPSVVNPLFEPRSCRRCLASVRGRRLGRHLMGSEEEQVADLGARGRLAAPLRILRPGLIHRPGDGTCSGRRVSVDRPNS